VEGIGAGQRCLDVGCGTGILGVRPALDHAAQVHCIDIGSRAVPNTPANAFCNTVSELLAAATVDLYRGVDRALLVSEGTVELHVKNLPNVSNGAEAATHDLRSSLRAGS
jgi:ribosomal protein L11 methylase PrmA